MEPILRLMAASEAHAGFMVPQILRCIVPPLRLGQHTGVVEDGVLVAWASWAFMEPGLADRFLADEHKVQPEDWCSGDRLVFMDFIAPHGHAMPLYRRLRELFGTQPAAWVRHTRNKRVEVFSEQ